MSFLSTLLAVAPSFMAQSYDYLYSTADDTAAAGAFGIATLIAFLPMCCAILYSLVALGLTIWMLIDVLKRTEAELPDRTMWILIIILTGGIGALVYMFTKRKQLNKK